MDLSSVPMEIEEMPSTLKEIPIESSDSDSGSDSSTETTSKKKGKTKRSRREHSKLEPHLKGLMGEANLRYARGDLETAKKMCYEVIRQAPESYEPYLTLSQIYENRNIKKYQGYLMLAGHLNPHDVNVWCRLAELYLQENSIVQAIHCYTKAIQADGKNIDLHMKRLELIEQKGDHKTALICKLKIAKALHRKYFDNIIKISMDVAKEYYNDKKYERAIEALDIPFKRIPEKINQNLLNMMLELLIASERFTDCLDVFTRFCDIEFEIFVQDDQSILIHSYSLPNNLQIDLKMKLIVCIIRLKSFHLVPDLINSIVMEDDVETMGDLYLDVVEALMTMECYEQALKLLVPLVKSKNFSLAAVWLKYAECLAKFNMPEQAIESYFTVMHLAPQHVEVLYPLAMLLLSQNKKQEALDVMAQDLSANKLDCAVLIERMKLLKQINHLDEYWKCVELLLSRHCVILKNIEELKVVITQFKSLSIKIERLRKLRLFRGDSPNIETDFECINELSIEDEYELYKEILQFAKDQKAYHQFQKFAFMGLCSKRFHKMFDEILLFAFLATAFNRDNYHGYTIIRDIVSKKAYANNKLAWNWFTVILQIPEDTRHARFLERRLDKTDGFLRMIDANYYVSIGSYLQALSYYMKAYNTKPTSFVALMLGVVMLQIIHQKHFERDKRKAYAETVCCLFLNYAKIRSEDAKQEVYYNLGRMYQQLGVIHLAEVFYKKSLEVSNEFLDKYPEFVGLRQEAAYNLHIIYKNSGNMIAARKVLMKYIVI